MESSRVHLHRKHQERALSAFAGFAMADLFLRWVMELDHPVLRLLTSVAAVCSLFFCVRYWVTLYRARVPRRRHPYPH